MEEKNEKKMILLTPSIAILTTYSFSIPSNAALLCVEIQQCFVIVIFLENGRKQKASTPFYHPFDMYIST